MAKTNDAGIKSSEIEIKKSILEDIDSKSSNKKKKVLRRPKKRARRIKEQIFHSYIPIHELLTEEEVFKLSDQKIIPEKLPYIYISDPAIRHLEIKLGDVIKITRNNPTLGKTVYYRVVVSE